MAGKSLVLSALALKAKEDENLRVGFVSLSESSKSIYDDAVRRFCEGNNIRMLSKEEKDSLKNYLYKESKYEATDDTSLTDTVTELAQKYDCLFIDEIIPVCYHSE